MSMFESNKKMNKCISIPLIIFIIIFFADCYLSYSLEALKNPLLYENEICSFAGKFNKTNNNTTCICNEQYASLPSDSPNYYIYGNALQCSVLKKRQFIALFLAMFLPFGFHFIYLEYYYLFVIHFLFFCVSIY